jgi:alkanesulfonate monooxygenase SsuD/methylene tetrahydromethanopterin reductase-like flavin-dependent oxidoreductase (luciferase family)
VNFGLRFDFRNPALAGTSMADRYAAALDMAQWADELGCLTIMVSEHHGSDDGYLPSPLTMIAAMAARTTTVRFSVAALIAPLHDPLRLAEDMLVLDNLSRGRVDLIIAGGYALHELEMFDVPGNQRGQRVVEAIETIRAAFRGDPFVHRGRTVHLTPASFREGGPTLIMGGSSEPAARRAARIADGFVPSTGDVWEFYRDEVQKLGRPDPGPSLVTSTTTVALAADVEQGWRDLGPYFLHETNAYTAWNDAAGMVSPYTACSDLAELRASGQYSVLTPEAFIVEQEAAPFPFAILHPMCGGIPPALAWEGLRLFEHEVLPAFG